VSAATSSWHASPVVHLTAWQSAWDEGPATSNPSGMKGTFTPTYGVKVPFMPTVG
jgi:hypothetical protein